MTALLAVIVLAAATAPDHASCPMAAAHAHRDGVDRRHDEATGVGHAQSTHHFTLGPDGGSIRLEGDDAPDTAGRDRIRAHLRAIAEAFGAGDFALPTRIHDQVPPGVDVMTARRDPIRSAFEPTERGGGGG